MISECGGSVSDRIFGGQDAKREDYPWLVGLLITQDGKDQLICGGSLISETLILTAAHCIQG